MLGDDLGEISSFVEAPVRVDLHLAEQQQVGVSQGVVDQGAGGEIERGTVGLAVGHLLKEGRHRLTSRSSQTSPDSTGRSPEVPGGQFVYSTSSRKIVGYFKTRHLYNLSPIR